MGLPATLKVPPLVRSAGNALEVDSAAKQAHLLARNVHQGLPPLKRAQEIAISAMQERLAAWLVLQFVRCAQQVRSDPMPAAHATTIPAVTSAMEEVRSSSSSPVTASVIAGEGERDGGCDSTGFF